jgi:tRNA-dihydrouridine synthase B
MAAALKIGKIVLTSPLILAPLAGYTDVAFRRLCRDCGAGLTVTEMTSVKGLCYGSRNTRELLRTAPNERPSCVQLFGSDPAFFERALALPELAGFDIIDVNMGCPMPKITKNGDGSALLSDPAKAAKIVAACVKAGGGRPVTVKMRIFGDAIAFARALCDAGAAMLAVHGRTPAQRYSGAADWDAIGNIARALPIPVAGNGDVVSVSGVRFALKTYGVSGVMIGRGALGNPAIFSGADGDYFGGHSGGGYVGASGGDYFGAANGGAFSECRGVAANGGYAGAACCDSFPDSAVGERPLPPVLRHLNYLTEYFPDRYAVTGMRKHLVYYLCGVPGAKRLKSKIAALETAAGLFAELKSALYQNGGVFT